MITTKYFTCMVPLIKMYINEYELFVFVVITAAGDGDDDTILVDDINTGHVDSVDGCFWIT